MSNNVINLLDAAYFSALAYAPITQLSDAIAWGKLPEAGGVLNAAAFALTAGGWLDETQSLINAYNKDPLDGGPAQIRFFDTVGTNSLDGPVPLNEFRVFVNNITHEVVFTFKGSSLNPNNWISDVSTNDQGYTQYAAIEASAEALYEQMQTKYAGYQFFADGHSLGGGMAQTFALQNNISGFGQNALPIAPRSQTTNSYWIDDSFDQAKLAYGTGPGAATFQELNLQGDIASVAFNTVYTGGYYLNSNLTKWLSNPDFLSESALATLGSLEPALKIPLASAMAVDAGQAHTLGVFIPLAIAQLGSSGGTGFTGSPAATVQLAGRHDRCSEYSDDR